MYVFSKGICLKVKRKILPLGFELGFCCPILKTLTVTAHTFKVPIEDQNRKNA